MEEFIKVHISNQILDLLIESIAIFDIMSIVPMKVIIFWLYVFLLIGLLEARVSSRVHSLGFV